MYSGHLAIKNWKREPKCIPMAQETKVSCKFEFRLLFFFLSRWRFPFSWQGNTCLMYLWSVPIQWWVVGILQRSSWESQFSRRSHLGPQAEPQTEEELYTHTHKRLTLIHDISLVSLLQSTCLSRFPFYQALHQFTFIQKKGTNKMSLKLQGLV